jgi:hypothetical protein
VDTGSRQENASKQKSKDRFEPGEDPRRGLTGRALCQNATGAHVVLRFGTPVERTAPESLL